MYASCIHGRYPGKINKTPETVQATTLKSIFKWRQKVLRVRGGGNLQEDERRKWLVSKGYPTLQIRLSGEKAVSGNSSLPGRGPLSNVNFPYKCRFPLQKGKFYSAFRSSAVSAVSWNNQLKIILRRKRQIWGWHIQHQYHWFQTNLISLLLQETRWPSSIELPPYVKL